MATGHISKRSVDALKASDRDQFLWDDEIRGFGVKVTPAGKKTYIFQYRIAGRAGATRRATLGLHGNLTPDDARTAAKDAATLVSKGIHPTDDKRDREKARKAKKLSDEQLAFKTYCTDTYLKARKPELRPRTYEFVEAALRCHAYPALGSKPLPEITSRDIGKMLDGIKQDSVRYSVFGVLRTLFKWAAAKGREDINASPMDGMTALRPVESRDRVLSDPELALALKAANALNAPYGSFYSLLFATGQRRDEVAALDWAELDRTEKLWTLPRERAKNGKANLVPLNELAMAALDRVAGGDKWPKAGFVFPATDKTSISGFSKAKRALDAKMLEIARSEAEAAGDDPEAVTLNPWRLHDARRTLATGLQRLGVRFEVTEAVLNHTSGASRAGVAGIYQRHGWGPEKRAALDAWAAHCSRVLTRDNASNVVALRQGA
jgi:integrase